MTPPGGAPAAFAQPRQVRRRRAQRRHRAARHAASSTSPNAAATVARSSPARPSRGIPSGAARRKSGSVTALRTTARTPAGSGHEKRFRHLQPDQLRPRRADGAAHRQVAPPALGAHQEQIGHVGAGDEEHDRNRAQQHPERGARGGTDHPFEHRLHDCAVLFDHAGVVRAAAEARGSSLESRVSSAASCSRVTPSFMRATTGAPSCPGEPGRAGSR